jgi:hypothetical protein
VGSRDPLTHDLKMLRLLLSEYEPGCTCNMPEEGEDGIIYCLACRLRDFFDLGHTQEHRKRAPRAERAP